MCGIIGGNINTWDYNEALKCMAHRGPDGMRIEEMGGFNFGFVRLSIRDLSTNAMQPMHSKDKKIIVLFNGEIYGYDNLKKELMKKNFQFNTTSDTEVILNAYIAFGEKFIEMIDGMFSIAIYDNNKRKIFLYRDRFGIKPLFYYSEGTKFAFASELKAIKILCNREKLKRDDTALYDYFTYRYIPEPKTIFQNVWKLEPGKKLSYNLVSGKITIEKYWKLHINTSVDSKYNMKNIESKLRNLISQSVREQLIADVPVGTFLSGGIDSSIISAEISRSSKKVQAFSMGFNVNQNEKQFDETSYAQIVANKFEMPILISNFNETRLGHLKDLIKNWYDEPFADTSCYPTFAISKYAKDNNVKVILTGDGGDEIFGGYSRYEKCCKKWENIEDLNLIKKLYTQICAPYFDTMQLKEELFDMVAIFAKEAYAYPRKMKEQYIKNFHINKYYDDYWYFRKYYQKELPPITRAQYIDLKTYLPSDILTKIDRVSMQNSIETRVPFLSKKIVEFSFALPQNCRCPNGKLKGLLKQAYKDILPKEILEKEKKGFSFPNRYWNGRNDSRFIIWDELWKRDLKKIDK